MLAALERVTALAFSGEVTKSLLLSVLPSSVSMIAGEEGQVGADGDIMSSLILLKEGEGTSISSPATEDRSDKLKLSLSLFFQSTGA